MDEEGLFRSGRLQERCAEHFKVIIEGGYLVCWLTLFGERDDGWRNNYALRTSHVKYTTPTNTAL